MTTSTSVFSVDDVIHESKITARQWIILTLSFLAYILEGFDIVVIAYTAPAISADWGMTPQDLGFVFSAGLLGMTLGAMFLASLADVYGRRIVVVATLLVGGMATCGVACIETVTQLMILRFVAGLAFGALVVTLPSLAGEYSPRRYRTLILGVLFAGSSLGPVIGGVLSAEIIPVFGWRVLFLYAGLLTVAVGIAVWQMIPESMAYIVKRQPDTALQRVNRILAKIGQHPLEALPPVPAAETSESASVVSLFTPTRRKMTMLMWLGFLLGYATVYFLASWVPQILVNAGLTQEQGIRGGVLVSLGGVIGTALYGFAARWVPLNLLIAGGFVLGAALMALASTVLTLVDGSQLVLLALLFLTGLTMMGAFANLYTVAITIYPAQVRNTGLGWAAGFGRFGAVISPAAAGLLIAAGTPISSLLLIFATLVLVAACCVVLIRVHELA